MAARGVLRTIEGNRLGFWCPGCECMHVVDSGWTFNGDYDKPTFGPSVLVKGGHYASQWKPGENCWCTFYEEHPPKPGVRQFKCGICHTFVINGEIQFLNDCTHELAGKTVPLKAFE